jgi:hypothetical protein
MRFFKAHELKDTGDRFRSCDLPLVGITISLSDLYARANDVTDDVYRRASSAPHR